MPKFNVVVEDRLWRNVEVEAASPAEAMRKALDQGQPQIVLENKGKQGLWYDGEWDAMDVFYHTEHDDDWGIYPEYVLSEIKRKCAGLKEEK